MTHKVLVGFVILGNTLHTLVMCYHADNTYRIVFDVVAVGLTDGIGNFALLPMGHQEHL